MIEIKSNFQYRVLFVSESNSKFNMQMNYDCTYRIIINDRIGRIIPMIAILAASRAYIRPTIAESNEKLYRAID